MLDIVKSQKPSLNKSFKTHLNKVKKSDHGIWVRSESGGWYVDYVNEKQTEEKLRELSQENDKLTEEVIKSILRRKENKIRVIDDLEEIIGELEIREMIEM